MNDSIMITHMASRIRRSIGVCGESFSTASVLKGLAIVVNRELTCDRTQMQFRGMTLKTIQNRRGAGSRENLMDSPVVSKVGCLDSIPSWAQRTFLPRLVYF